MRKISIFALIASLFTSSVVMANEVNVFNARHYKADAELYNKFTNKTGIKVNLINGKAGAAMQAFASQLNPAEIAAVVTYERNAWGNNVGDMAQPREVNALITGEE